MVDICLGTGAINYLSELDNKRIVFAIYGDCPRICHDLTGSLWSTRFDLRRPELTSLQVISLPFACLCSLAERQSSDTQQCNIAQQLLPRRRHQRRRSRRRFLILASSLSKVPTALDPPFRNHALPTRRAPESAARS